MAKDQPTPLEPLEKETVFFLREKEDFPYRGQWIIYSKTKYGDKYFNNFASKDAAIKAAEYYKINLQI